MQPTIRTSSSTCCFSHSPRKKDLDRFLDVHASDDTRDARMARYGSWLAFPVVFAGDAGETGQWFADRLTQRILQWQKLQCYKGEWQRYWRLFQDCPTRNCWRRSRSPPTASVMLRLDSSPYSLRLMSAACISAKAAHLSSPTVPQVLHLSEHAAYGRIEAARAARRFPIVLELLTDGSVTLTAVTLLACHLSPDNHREVLNDARHRSKREVEQIVARLRPQLPVPSTVRKLPEPTMPLDPVGRTLVEPSAEADSPRDRARPPLPHPAKVIPLAPERYKVQFTVSQATHDKLRRVQDLLRHSIPNGDPAAVFDRALTFLLADLEKTKLAATGRSGACRSAALGSRHIPAAVRREVWKRDAGRCAFVGAQGRCTERGFLEFHHIAPYAVGGQATAENISLRCRAHNVHEAEQYLWGSIAAVATGDESRGVQCSPGPDRVPVDSGRR